MNGKPVGIGLVGAGAFGDFCLAAFAEVPEVQIAAVCDSDAARASKFANQYHAQAYTTLDDLLIDPSVEIVALNTPPFLHAEQGIAALQAGKHLFCEKPLALNLKDAEIMRETAERNHVHLTVDYVMRFNPLWIAAANIRASGVLGKLLHMDLANHAAGLNLPDSHWFWDKPKSGGIWIEHGVHFFDAFGMVAGETGAITHAQSFINAKGQEDRVEALAHYGNTSAHFYHGFTHSGVNEQTTVRFAFESGYITLYEWVPTLMVIESVTTENLESIRSLLPGQIEVTSADSGLNRAEVQLTQGKSAVYRECIQSGIFELARSVRDSGNPLRVTGDHGFTSLAMAVGATNMNHA